MRGMFGLQGLGRGRLGAHQHERFCCSVSVVECWLLLALTLSTTRHVNRSSLIQKATSHSYNLSANGGTDSGLNTETMARPADTIVFHTMSGHDRRFLFLNLDAGM